VSFDPPFCPDRNCPNHLQPARFFYKRTGYYKPQCRTEPVPRFKCKTCNRGFSRQTFRADYGHRRPEINVAMLEMIVSGTGLRQIARMLKIGSRSIQARLRRFGTLHTKLHDRLCPSLPAGRTFVFDEEETYEAASIRPLTVPLVVEAETWFVVSTAVGTIRRRAKKGSKRREKQDREEEERGVRRDQSAKCVKQMLEALQRRVPEGSLELLSDEKPSYQKIVQELFGERATHVTISGEAPRTPANPLFPVNNTIAMTRDNCGRLRRDSWLVSKRAQDLRHQLALYVVYRNYVRQHFNHDARHESPATFLGLLPRALTVEETVRWRQDLGPRSVHPMSVNGEAVDLAVAA
jgi:transposase-like protein